jgi:ferritin-like metal-binding protein YciE
MKRSVFAPRSANDFHLMVVLSSLRWRCWSIATFKEINLGCWFNARQRGDQKRDLCQLVNSSDVSTRNLAQPRPFASGAEISQSAPNRQGVKQMGFFSKDITTLDELFIHTLQDIYYAEKQIESSLPSMIEKASNAELKSGFELHLGQTRSHIERLEKIFEMEGVEPKEVDCPAIDGILAEANDVAGDIDDKSVMDAALIAAAQAVEHYEITRYGSLIAWANELGRSDDAALLQQTLEEEKETDRKLTALATRDVNLRAAE